MTELVEISIAITRTVQEIVNYIPISIYGQIFTCTTYSGSNCKHLVLEEFVLNSDLDDMFNARHTFCWQLSSILFGVFFPAGLKYKGLSQLHLKHGTLRVFEWLV